MPTETYSLAEVLAVAKTHPFYNPDVQYPADAKAIQRIRELVNEQPALNLQDQPLLTKNILYKTIKRLTHDVDSQNTYRHSSYTSITGGGSGGIPMMFAVDVHENRRQRAQMGKFLRRCGVIEPHDWVLSTQLAGGFYRALDLTTELIENAGGTILSAGSYMLPAEVAQALADYHVNVLSGDSSQIIRVVNYISTMTQQNRDRININKIIYTSEPLTGPQRAFIKKVLGDVKIFSILGSAEVGPWAISIPDLMKDQDPTSTTDFIFDTRNVLVEIFPSSALQDTSLPSLDPILDPLPQGESGLIVQTSLQRLRNPVVRYIAGDIGSVHPIPDVAYGMIPEAEYLRVLRMQGRDRRFSFKWFGNYFEFEKIDSFMQVKEHGILQWQIILGQLQTSPQVTLEMRLFRSSQEEYLSDQALIQGLMSFFTVFPENEHLFRVVFLEDLGGFERSATAEKIIKFVDRCH
ncbi:uncharacterized protein N7484_004484 [Penicillium longicatenatum]|uniref:uncharacterized protein n=1 Tax=Penicillium longicatenatum TaxID=1561947 RepID=UPI0025481FE6|nr:uncharacterized protein N7484_004484 [Penicillium longicatenatum]KAJ5650761.1 hypothetical protein N7484_004484 [Penicillium longicatenatum]